MTRQQSTLSELARIGFTDLGSAKERIIELGEPALVRHFAAAPDPDQALARLLALRESAPVEVADVLADSDAAGRLIQLLGASTGIADFFTRRPAELVVLHEVLTSPQTAQFYDTDLLAVVGSDDDADPAQVLQDDAAWVALRVRYRRHLVQLAAWDLCQSDPLGAVDRVAAALADLAGAALEAGLVIARRAVPFPAGDVAATRLAIIGMGKTGARELNYLSDVDVIFVVGGEGELSDDRAVQIGTRLAIELMRGMNDLAAEPGLWEVDANLRPEGKDGALVRTLDSHIVYYQRWAKSWEFQALLKARVIAGDLELGQQYVDALAPLVWSSASRENFVESVQGMRERVTANIPADEVDVQLKLGPGGLRDVEFTIQLLQLVHGQTDTEVRQEATIPALVALAERGYIGRTEAAEFALDYRFLRLLEHRIQLSRLRRTHLMPVGDNALRVLARATGVARDAQSLVEQWQRTKHAVRRLHERLFYRPLLSAVAALPDGGIALSSEQAQARLAAIGFTDPRGALAHIAALTGGVSRRASIQRALLPVMLEWFAQGADPDRGLLVFRRMSEDLGESYWFLRMLRDSSGAAHRLTQVLSGSKFVGDLFEQIPEAAAWLESDDELQPRSTAALLEEAAATVARHSDNRETAALTLRTARRREVLRTALGNMLGVTTIEQVGHALADITTTTLTGALALVHDDSDRIEFGIIAMGRYGGAELGFGSDADVMYVYRAIAADDDDARKLAETIVKSLGVLTEDVRIPLDLDAGLRPEGKTGVIVRSLDSYRAYYQRWSLTWEAQALLRAKPVAGDPDLLTDFELLANEVRYPVEISAQDVREVKRIKARVEAERLPQAADPSRHLKLGRGSLSDVEWLVQLQQLQHGARVEGLRTTSTLAALDSAVEVGLISAADAQTLRHAWTLASRVRSAMTLWTSRTADVLPTDRRQLDAVARLLEYPPGSATRFEEDYFRATRRARRVFEKRFYGPRR